MSPAAARRLYEDQLPSFMTVFGHDDGSKGRGGDRNPYGDSHGRSDRGAVAVADADARTEPGTLAFADRQHAKTGPAHSQPRPQANHGTSAQTSESTGSSPTTTLSTTDSSHDSDPSPSSPTSISELPRLVPLNNYPSTSFGRLAPSMASLSIDDELGSPSHLERPMTSPAPRRPRNMKGLSIQPPFLTSNTIALGSDLASPAFIKPVAVAAAPPVKRKPSLLSLKTNACDLVAKSHHEVPNSPGVPPILQRRALKHSTSTPHMLSGLMSCTFGPAGGMTLPRVLDRNESGLSEVLRPLKSSMNPSFETVIHEEESPIKPQLASRAQIDREPYAEQENNEDQKSPGYPDGPIAIYGDNVFLYMEPTAREASRFDLVINVAREVRNPFHPNRDDFEGQEEDNLQPKMTSPQFPSPDPSPVFPPDTAATNATFMTALEHQIPDDPQCSPSKRSPQEPEYVHMPWDHHTNIAPDLMSLCEKIDGQTKDGKRVLIHCQQGASRSASLIIAYGMYLNSELSVNDAYYAAQARSRWISPNMKLMYCLQDFQKEVIKRRMPPPTGFRQRNNRSPSKHKLALSADTVPVSPKAPRTAPLPSSPAASAENTDAQSPVRESPACVKRLGITSPSPGAVSPGPSSAPSSFSWPGAKTEPNGRPNPGHDNLPLRPKTGIERPVTDAPSPPGRLMTKPIVNGSYTHVDALMSPRAEIMIRKPFRDAFEPPPKSTPAPASFNNGPSSVQLVEIPPTPSEVGTPFSPRGSLVAGQTFFPFVRPAQADDPRSPATVGEAQIVRSIDEQLL